MQRAAHLHNRAVLLGLRPKPQILTKRKIMEIERGVFILGCYAGREVYVARLAERPFSLLHKREWFFGVALPC